MAADTASRSSVAYAQIIFRHFLGTSPEFIPAHADAEAMLREADAALLIGDPALLALERRDEIEARVGLCAWYDVAELWRERTGLPWVAAVWAVRPEAVPSAADRRVLMRHCDLNGSRDHGLKHIDDLVQEWTPKIALPPQTIRHYLQHNIHYLLDDECVQSIAAFRSLATQVDALDALPELPFLTP